MVDLLDNLNLLQKMQEKGTLPQKTAEVNKVHIIHEGIARIKNPCRHLGDITRKGAGCGGLDVYHCGVHGECTKTPCQQVKNFCLGGQPNSCGHYEARDKVRKLILHNKLSPGDCLVMTGAIKCLHEQFPNSYLTAVSSPCPALYEHNPHVQEAGEDWEELQMEYPAVHRCNQEPIHFLQGYVEYLGDSLKIPLKLTTNRPHLYLSDEEKGWLPQVEEITKRKTPYWVINAGTKQDFTAKGWGHNRYQKVVDALAGKVFFVQVGEAGHLHKPLDGVLNLLGKTDLRQLVRLCWHAAGGIGPTTLLQHMMAAFEKHYVCLLGGREPLSWVNYPRQTTLHTLGSLECCKFQSCWKTRTVAMGDGEDTKHSLCDQPTPEPEQVPRCMALIRPEEAVSAVERYLL